MDGRNAYCVFQKAGDNYIGRVIASCDLYRRIPQSTAALAICLAAVVIALNCAVTRYMNRYVVNGIEAINEKLGRIAEGNLDEEIAVQSSEEFARLSSYINIMKRSSWVPMWEAFGGFLTESVKTALRETRMFSA